jgi:hypothetical protein
LVTLTRPAERLDPRHARHADIADHHRKRFLREKLERGLARTRGLRAIALRAQKRFQETALAVVIVHDQNSRGFHRVMHSRGAKPSSGG